MFTGRIRMRRARDLRAERDRHALVRLHRQDELVRLHADRALGLEGEVRHRLQRHRDLGDLAREPLARAQVDRHARPAPVVHLEPQRHVGLGLRVGGHALLLEVADGLLALAPCPPCTGRAPTALRRVGGSTACRTFTFSSRTSSASNVTGGSMQSRRQQLEHVVLDQVAQRARLVVVARRASRCRGPPPR